MELVQRLLLGLSLLLASACAEVKLGQIRGRISIPQKFQQDLLPMGGLGAAKVTLDGGLVNTLPTADGYFFIAGVPVGPHLLQVIHPQLNFDPVTRLSCMGSVRSTR
eukprot:TRINITY_DN29036_c0_g1_i1.p1 TRINITY_DN29036_c0_g1~~TRINITY_DN29036_c0_g1_i1.p1  ORF type:complete len:107 (-),score=11.31 TRINITY_DN29036_c0_g1_i1:16-336(-)